MAVTLDEMERRLAEIYRRADAEIEATANAYFDRFIEADEKQRKLVQQGKMTEEAYTAWRKGKLMYGKRYSALKEQIAQQLLKLNETAAAYINGQTPELYAINYNALADDVDGIGGYSFTLTDADTIRNLAVTDKSLLPLREIDPKKDIPWNTKKVNAEVLQGIIQGESIPKIAKRMHHVQAMNAESAIRSARTIVTNAECKGRQDSYKRAQEDGIILKKYWIATYDKRARDWHKEAGNNYTEDKAIDIDDYFVVDGEKMLHPGDNLHGAHGHNLYNCRCSMAAKVIGFKSSKSKGYTQAEMDEFVQLSKKYKSREEVMLFGTSEDVERWAVLEKKVGKIAPDQTKRRIQKPKETKKEVKKPLRGVRMTREEADIVQSRWVQNGYADKVFLPTDMDVDVVKRLEDRLEELVNKKGYAKVKAIVYDPKECALRNAAAFYDQTRDRISIGSKFKLTNDECEKAIASGFEKAKKRAAEKEFSKYAAERIESGEKRLSFAKTGYDKAEAWRTIRDGYMLKGYSARPSVAQTLDEIFVHEFGHAMHLKSGIILQGCRKKEYGEWNTYSFSKKTVEPFMQATEMSAYAATSPLEAVAEAFLAREKGEAVPSVYEAILKEIDAVMKK